MAVAAVLEQRTTRRGGARFQTALSHLSYTLQSHVVLV